MSNENHGKAIERADKDLIKMFETTEEYKEWQESLFAIIGYIANEENDDEELIMELITDHLNTSFALQKGLESARLKKSKNLHEDWLLDNSGQ
jgi:hypothetical protein